MTWVLCLPVLCQSRLATGARALVGRSNGLQHATGPYAGMARCPPMHWLGKPARLPALPCTGWASRRASLPCHVLAGQAGAPPCPAMY
eukprot:363929-Chlamydomonas_euryale.AAC.3